MSRQSEKIQLVAVVRVDLDMHHKLPDTPPANWITVKEVLPTWDAAEEEVLRLNALNADKGAIYFASIARYYPHGRKTIS